MKLYGHLWWIGNITLSSNAGWKLTSCSFHGRKLNGSRELCPSSILTRSWLTELGYYCADVFCGRPFEFNCAFRNSSKHNWEGGVFYRSPNWNPGSWAFRCPFLYFLRNLSSPPWTKLYKHKATTVTFLGNLFLVFSATKAKSIIGYYCTRQETLSSFSWLPKPSPHRLLR